MKKNSLFVGIFLLFSIIFTACKINVKPSNSLHRPDVDTKQVDGIRITIQKSSSDIQYINIYRKNVETNKVENIALVFPNINQPDDRSISFVDRTYENDKDYQYSYRAYQGKYGYFQSDFSDKIKNAANGSPVTITTGTNEKLIFNAQTSTLSYSADTKAQIYGSSTDDYEFALVVTNGDETKTFPISDKDWSTTSWELLQLLPETFIETQVTILGIIGQKQEKNDEGKLTQVLWTPLHEIPVESATTDYLIEANRFIIKKFESGRDGLDFGLMN